MNNFANYKSLLAIVSFAALVAGSAQSADAQGTFPRHHPQGEYRHILRHLHFSRGERAEIRPIQRSERREIAQVRHDRALTPRERRQEVHQIQRSTIDQIRTDLTPAQRRKLNDRLADRSAHRHHGF